MSATDADVMLNRKTYWFIGQYSNTFHCSALLTPLIHAILIRLGGKNLCNLCILCMFFDCALASWVQWITCFFFCERQCVLLFFDLMVARRYSSEVTSVWGRYSTTYYYLSELFFGCKHYENNWASCRKLIIIDDVAAIYLLEGIIMAVVAMVSLLPL